MSAWGRGGRLSAPHAASRPQVKAEGIQNILALRGDPPKGSSTFEAVEGGFACALDLVRYIRAEYGDFFGLTVAGYPEAHPDGISTDDPEKQKAAYAGDLAYLKQKVDAGGEVVVTQLFYDVELFLKFVSDCRDAGITVPIIPGVMPIQTYGGFKRMTGFCKTYVPPDISALLDSIQDNEEAVRAYGVKLGVDMCRRMLSEQVTPGVHLYSLNSDKAVISILQGLGLVPPPLSPPPRPLLPFRQPVSTKGRRCEETSRPLFWVGGGRTKAYALRTSHWPHPLLCGADAAPAPFAPLTPELLQKLLPRSGRALAQRSGTFEGASATDAASLRPQFMRFLEGSLEGSSAWPWCESGRPSASAAAALEGDAKLLRSLVLDQGLLLLDCGLAVHGRALQAGEPAGWGANGGRLYQKGYALGFAPKQSLPALVAAMAALPGGGSILSHSRPEGEAGPAVAMWKGAIRPSAPPSALAWGVWPGRPVSVPVTVSFDAFAAWAPEAWALAGAGEGAGAAPAGLLDSHVLFLAVGEDPAAEGTALLQALQAALTR